MVRSHHSNICRWSPQKKQVCPQFAQLQLDEASRAACQYAEKPEQSAREADSVCEHVFFLFVFLLHIPNAGPKSWACSMLREKKAACDSAKLKVVCVRKRSLLKLPPLRFVHVRALIGKTRFSLRLRLLRGFVCV